MRNLVLYFFLIKLKVLLDFALGYINKYSKVAKIFLKKSFELGLGQELYITPIFVLVPAKTNLPTKKKGDK